MITVKTSRICDAVLAHSALRGDITGRGDILVDNDDHALSHIIRMTVPDALERCRIPYSTTCSGWRIESDRYGEGRLLTFLTESVLHRLRPDVNPVPRRIDPDGGADIPLLRNDTF